MPAAKIFDYAAGARGGTAFYKYKIIISLSLMVRTAFF
jgi:hypothetical protein